jgi:LAS superfamily LD-carboxypeptidase LdcB
MIKLGKMTPAGLKAVEKQYNPEKDKAESKNLIIASDILEKIKSNKEAWKNFQNFSIGYKRVRISAIEGYRNYQGNNKLFDSKLAYFIKMSAKSKTFGVLRD